jgi:phage shock protein PspC (stress-responsive transcriptional regulator)
MTERLHRSRDERILVGVAGGVAEALNVDPSLVRVLWVILTPLTGGLALLVYVVMAFIVPDEPADSDRRAGWSNADGSSGPTGAGQATATASRDADPATGGGAAGGGFATSGGGTASGGRGGRHRDGTGVLMFGLLLVLVGSFFLARAYIPGLDLDRLWPVLLVAIGVVLLIGSVRRSSPPP